MAIREAIGKLVERHDLTAEEAEAAMAEVMAGEATPAQIGAFITALRMKGETAVEMAALARAMRAAALRVEAPEGVVDTCGTGGDGTHSFNISTTAAFVVAGAGVKVAKHGNRAVTSGCGSADLLEALGVAIDLPPEGVVRCIERAGIGFMFAPRFHPAMRHAAGPRRELGIRTVFNVLGPLTNPAGARYQLLGVASAALAARMAEVLRLLGTRRALVVHGEGGFDECSLVGSTTVHEVEPGGMRAYELTPEALGLPRAAPEDLRGGDVQRNAAITLSVLRDEPSPAREATVLNAAAALYAAEAARTLAEGVALARETLAAGRALAALDLLRAESQRQHQLAAGEVRA